MEVEAKFRADASICRQLSQMKQLAGYDLDWRESVSVRDHYYDTSDQAIRRHGYALRLRRKEQDVIAALKSLTPATEEGVHRREEYEQRLQEETADATIWPVGEVRTRVLILTQGQPLERLFTIMQRRQKSHIIHDGRPIAELSCDAVEATSDDARAHWHELEVELLAAGTNADLDAIIDGLRSHVKIIPEFRSKYERGRELLE